MWFAPIIPLKFENNVLVLQVKSQFMVEYIEDNYIDLLRKTLFRVYGKGIRLEYRVLIDSQSGKGSTILSEGVEKQTPQKEEMPARSSASYDYRPAMPRLDSQLNPQYTFASFVEGECNKLPRNAGQTIAREPGKTIFNPIFIYGGSGVGRLTLPMPLATKCCVCILTKECCM